ncbi:hypothetical protein WA158_005077 [Blastocystis sp. Blastoise]
MTRMYTQGLTTTSGGNVSSKDSEGNVWLTPSGTDKSCISPDEVCFLDTKGDWNGRLKPTIEWQMHTKIYSVRPDVCGIVHAHSQSLVSYAISRVLINTQMSDYLVKYLGNVDQVDYYICGGCKLAENVAKCFGESNNKNAVLLYSHGIIVTGSSLQTAFQRFELLERYTEMSLLLLSLSNSFKSQLLCERYTDQSAIILSNIDYTQYSLITNSYKSNAEILLKFLQRSYMKHLISSEALFSSKTIVDDIPVVIYSKPSSDPGCMTVEDMFMCYISPSSSPSSSLSSYNEQRIALHQYIYEHTSIACIYEASPIAATALFLSGHHLQPMMPETLLVVGTIQYIDIPLHSQCIYTYKDTIIQYINEGATILYFKGGNTLVLGKSPIQCYDRLEVLENICVSIINSLVSLSSLRTMTPPEIEEVYTTFGKILIPKETK